MKGGILLKTTTNKNILRYSDNELVEIEDAVAEEFPLTIYLNDVEFATMVCSPEHLEELVIGFLASEGAIKRFSDIEFMNLDDHGGFCHIRLNREIPTDHFIYSKRILGSCCGKSRQFYFQNDVDTAKVSMAKTTLTPAQCIELMQGMQEQSIIFKETGGIHNASWVHLMMSLSTEGISEGITHWINCMAIVFRTAFPYGIKSSYSADASLLKS